MFDLGFSELLVIAVVALVVLGPQRLPKAARFAGLWVRKARAQWYSVKSEFEREMAAEDLKRSIGDPTRELRRDAEDIRRELDDTSAQVGAGLREVRADVEARDPPAAGKAADAGPPPDDVTGDGQAADEPTQPSLLPPRRDD
ncbi:Sec-independent protein translocase protein TatB [Arenimonas donghaensis]|uniref:Sec-independent protein translocase protein TatB n=1 Tax=Arenimonas donghaensis DSM 18148 = HO3-R19 TaxID=1121014 RepID=A0A087MGR5_9GAMM|nr:Sec-independent protein translocase protein TatB [Arenimonas donghaensis]KFL36068.1 hypothetical protein N788_05850 [Arenimonas donghaensis DSM 18148 = HO3-R19]